jgi:hypothetical protein
MKASRIFWKNCHKTDVKKVSEKPGQLCLFFLVSVNLMDLEVTPALFRSNFSLMFH